MAAPAHPIRIALIVATALAATAACAAEPAKVGIGGKIGMVADPCAGVPPEPAVITQYRKDRMDPAKAATLVPPMADIRAYMKTQAEQRKTDWPDLCRFRADNAALAARPAAERQVVFIGDSITQNWLIGDPGFFTEGGVSRGISGQTTPQMLLRFQADVVALHPRAVHIMAGINDLAGNTGPNAPQDFKNNIMAMVALAKAADIKVVLAAIPPSDAFETSPGVKPAAQIAALNAWLRDYARAHGVVFADYTPMLATPGGAVKPELTYDGLHPTVAGYALMEPIARRALAEALGR